MSGPARGNDRRTERGDDGFLELDVVIESPGWSALPQVEILVRRAATAALAAADIRESKHITVLLADNETVAELNGTWRGNPQPTNVLSFPAAPLPGTPSEVTKPMGDIALSWGVVEQEARQQGKTLENHSSHLIVHAVLHLAGFDHETDDAAAAMQALEVRALADLGMADPY